MLGVCFGNWGGSLAFGGAQLRHMRAENLSWTPMRTTAGKYQYYTVQMLGLSLGGEQLRMEPAPAMVDTGTTLLLLQPDLYRHLVRVFRERYPHLPGVTGNTSLLSPATDHQHCLRSSDTPDWSQWPTLELTLDGLVLQLPPTVYFWREQRDKWCFGVQPTPDTVREGLLWCDTVLSTTDDMPSSSNRSSIDTTSSATSRCVAFTPCN